MKDSFHRLAGLFFAVALAGCASAESERAMLAREALIGMPKAQLLSCAGVPNRTRQDANVEFFTYENEPFDRFGGTTVGVYGGTGHAGAGLNVPLTSRLQSDFCEATFTLVDGRVAQLVYSSSRGGRFAECARIVESCLVQVTGPQQN